MKEMPTNANFCYLSSSYPFGTTNFSAKAWRQQFCPTCVIHICNVISLAKDEQKMNYVGVLQTIVLTIQPRLLPKCERAATKLDCEIEIIWPQLIQILSTSLIHMSMGYHTYQSNRQLSKPKYHFVVHL